MYHPSMKTLAENIVAVTTSRLECIRLSEVATCTCIWVELGLLLRLLFVCVYVCVHACGCVCVLGGGRGCLALASAN